MNGKEYDVLVGKKGQKQVRFWSHPKVNPINLADLKKVLEREFSGVDESELWFVPGVANFWVERKTDGRSDTES